ncbi:hypothetical protein CHL76_02575 [Marinococcus halophilus]|uniref:Uncharacterized protein n=1 Tax=Marinococcus halophilus TaxID=1371 RepID=A0A510Y1K3_MARHA|nr:DUF5683 domain-containing protein [Marinococcus halophilus]OZT81260.1 hypothetical protein CHL76_02575 [Marinococcus halophilus]GEK57202.1 hypothetical protein MHA01_01070 [Marinococcus halophilus]
MKNKKMWIAGLLSLLIPGAGQVYVKKYLWAIIFFVLYVGLLITVYVPSIFVAAIAVVHAVQIAGKQEAPGK